MKNELIAVVLAAGVGKRFWPLTTPKPLFPFLSQPLVVHNLRKFRQAGFRRVILVINKQNQKQLSSLSLDGLEMKTVVQTQGPGMAGALLSAKSLVGTTPCVIMNAEDIVESDLLEKIVEATQGRKILVVGKKMTEYFNGGYFQFKDNRVVGIVEKPRGGRQPSDYVNLVFHFFPEPQRFFAALSSVHSKTDDNYEQALTLLLEKEGADFVAYEGYWQPLKYPWHVLEVMAYFLAHRLTPSKGKNVDIGQNVIIEGPVFFGDNVKVFENTKIIGPSYIGDNTIIGNNNIIRESHIGEDCITGFNSDITRSYVGSGCWFHSNYVGDSVLEGNVSLGSGAVLANLRLDEGEISSTIGEERIRTKRNKLGAMIGRHVRVGVNTSIMPGLKIGQGSMIGAGVVLDRDLRDDSFCVAKPGYETMKNTKKIAAGARHEFRKNI